MSCLQNLPQMSLSDSRSSVPPTGKTLKNHFKRPLILNMRMIGPDRRGNLAMNAYSGPASSTEKSGVEVKEEKSEIYSNNMTEAMGAVLTYRHELGMNYNFICPNLIVGSCLQTPSDVDKLRDIGVKTIFCLQQDSDLEYFGVDIGAIQEYAKKCEDIEHCRAEIRDFDAFDLRMRLPAVVSKLHKLIKKNGGMAYVHCTAGLGRAPATAVFLTIQTISPSENFYYMGNRDKAPVEAIGTYRLILDSGFSLDLCQTLYVPSISRNLIQ